MLLLMLTGWLERREREALTYLIEENRLSLLKTQSGTFGWDSFQMDALRVTELPRGPLCATDVQHIREERRKGDRHAAVVCDGTELVQRR